MNGNFRGLENMVRQVVNDRFEVKIAFPFAHLLEPDESELEEGAEEAQARALDEGAKAAIQKGVDYIKAELVAFLENRGTREAVINNVKGKPSREIVEELDYAFEFLLGYI